MGFFSLEGTLNGGGALLFGGGSSGAVSSGRIPFSGASLRAGPAADRLDGAGDPHHRRKISGWMVREYIRPGIFASFAPIFGSMCRRLRFLVEEKPGAGCSAMGDPRHERFVFVLTGGLLPPVSGFWIGAFPRLCLCGIESAGPGFPGPAFLLLSCSAGCGCVLMVCAIVVFLSDLLREGQKRIARCFSVGCAPPLSDCFYGLRYDFLI